jgi:hypothetical protein
LHAATCLAEGISGDRLAHSFIEIHDVIRGELREFLSRTRLQGRYKAFLPKMNLPE